MTETDRPRELAVDCPAGRVLGVRHGDVAVWRGVPFALRPDGPRYCRPPVPTWPATGGVDARHPGAAPPQPAGPAGTARPRSGPGSYLTVNIWTPCGLGRPAPVLAWLCVGGNYVGSNDWPLYDGSALARRGIAVVTVNARLGFEGFTPLDDAPDNRAALDWLAALRWVRDNIAAFGGDPDAVTLAGQSAGGGATAALLTASAARGLFRRAIVLSATTPSLDRELAYRQGARLLHSLGVAPTRAGLASVPEDALVAGAAAAYGPGWRVADPVQRVRNMLVGPPFRLVADAQLGIGEVLDASRAGAGAGVRVLAGHTAAEFTGQFAALGDRVDEAVLDAALAELGGPGPAVRRAYRERYGGLSPAATLGQAYTDAVFRLSNHRLASARRAGGGTTYVYEFSAADAGSAAHGADVPHIFGTAGGPAPEDTGRDLQDAVVRFVTSGEPGWEPYDRGGLVHRFGPDGREPAALAWERDVWPADRIPGR